MLLIADRNLLLIGILILLIGILILWEAINLLVKGPKTLLAPNRTHIFGLWPIPDDPLAPIVPEN